jgi:hypothetical protein
MDEFGEMSVIGTLETGISSPEDIELQDRHRSSSDRIDLNDYPRGEGELESIPPVFGPQNSGRFSLSVEPRD